VLLVTGSEDRISPPHQGQLIKEISGIEHVVISGAGHVPYILNDGADFMKVGLIQ
jgi:pimeloyl-ACP methyl ester carboxylesterase